MDKEPRVEGIARTGVFLSAGLAILAVFYGLSSTGKGNHSDATGDALWMVAVAVLLASIGWHCLRHMIAPRLRQAMLKLTHGAATENLRWPVPAGFIKLAIGIVRLAPFFGLAVLALQFVFQAETDLVPFGVGLLGLWWFGSIILWFLTMPARCAKGHADLRWVYGEWRCRTCYRRGRSRGRYDLPQ